MFWFRRRLHGWFLLLPGRLGTLLLQGRAGIGALACSDMFMAGDIGVRKLSAERARAGVRVRLLLGASGSPVVTERGAAEGPV